MIVNPLIIVLVSLIALCIFILGVYIKTSEQTRAKKREERRKQQEQDFLSGVKVNRANGAINFMNNNSFVQLFGDRMSGNSETEILFRKSKNPWNLTPGTFNFIRYGGLIFFAIVTVFLYAIFQNVTFCIISVMFGVICYILPKSHYQSVADRRENQWNQLYQFMWVIKHNIAFYDPKKTWMETEKYIKEHTNNLPELEEAFYDFSKHWNGEYMDDYIMRTYGDFAIPKQLFDIILVSQQTGEYPENELNSLRTIIINKMNFHVQEVLSTVGMKATLYSTPFVLASVSIVILIPVILSIAEAFG